MNKTRLALVIAVIQLLSALPLYAIYTMPIRVYGVDNYWSPWVVGGNLLGVLFLMLPTLAVVGVWKGWSSAYLWMGLYPVVAFLFGVVPIPFANYLYSDNMTLNTVVIGAIDALVVILVVWLFITTRVRANNASKPTP